MTCFQCRGGADGNFELQPTTVSKRGWLIEKVSPQEIELWCEPSSAPLLLYQSLDTLHWRVILILDRSAVVGNNLLIKVDERWKIEGTGSDEFLETAGRMKDNLKLQSQSTKHPLLPSTSEGQKIEMGEDEDKRLVSINNLDERRREQE